MQKDNLNIFESFSQETSYIKDTEIALLNILDDYSKDKLESEDIQRAFLNIFEDFNSEKSNIEKTQYAVLNILDDYSIEKSNQEKTNTAVLNILDDYNFEKNSQERTIQATLNILDDYNDEKINVNTMLMSVNKDLEAFSYSISHDLRAPLRAINGYANMLEEDYMENIDDEGKRLLGVIMQNAKKMGNLIDDLLSFSKLGKKEINKSNINMNELVPGIFYELMKTNNYNAKLKIKNLIPIKADLALMYQVISNLLSNALKYSAKIEKPVIEINSLINNNKTIFEFKDNGVGFDMKYYDKLFVVFQRLHSSTEFEGTGVGLAIVKRIINKHGGEVWAESKLNEGSTFYFSLPIN